MIAIGKLYQHALRFHKVSVDGSGKCDVFHTGLDTNYVWGVVVEIDPAEKQIIDAYEDYGNGYSDKIVDIELESGQILSTLTYYAIKVDPALRPYSWYLEFVLAGAREHGLPEDYVQALELVEGTIDPDVDRAQSNREILYGV
jgi:hypothetical protein